MIISEKGFEPLCQSTLRVVRTRQITDSAILSCRPCLKPDHPINGRCCDSCFSVTIPATNRITISDFSTPEVDLTLHPADALGEDFTYDPDHVCPLFACASFDADDVPQDGCTADETVTKVVHALLWQSETAFTSITLPSLDGSPSPSLTLLLPFDTKAVLAIRWFVNDQIVHPSTVDMVGVYVLPAKSCTTRTMTNFKNLVYAFGVAWIDDTGSPFPSDLQVRAETCP